MLDSSPLGPVQCLGTCVYVCVKGWDALGSLPGIICYNHVGGLKEFY